jgi:hypothetical protein
MEYHFSAYTLVDITDTKCNNPRGNSKEFLQAQNLSMLTQVLSLRSQLMTIKSTFMPDRNMDDYEFGGEYTGRHNVWKFIFSSEHHTTWLHDDKLFYHAITDTNTVPVYTGLDETANIDKFFNSASVDKLNIYFKEVLVA